MEDKPKCPQCGGEMKYYVCGGFWYCEECHLEREVQVPVEGGLLREEVAVHGSDSDSKGA